MYNYTSVFHLLYSLCIYVLAVVPTASYTMPQNAQRVSTSATVFSDRIANFEEVKCAGNDSNTLIIDVREPAELQETGVIPGSVNIPRELNIFLKHQKIVKT